MIITLVTAYPQKVKLETEAAATAADHTTSFLGWDNSIGSAVHRLRGVSGLLIFLIGIRVTMRARAKMKILSLRASRAVKMTGTARMMRFVGMGRGGGC